MILATMGDGPSSAGNAAGVAAATRRRRALLEAARALEAAASSAQDAPGSGARVEGALKGVATALAYHTATAEAEGALIEQVIRVAPRLKHEGDVLVQEHETIRNAADRLYAHLVADATAEAVRDEVHELQRLISTHRHRAADLVYKAYWMDIGAGD